MGPGDCAPGDGAELAVHVDLGEAGRVPERGKDAGGEAVNDHGEVHGARGAVLEGEVEGVGRAEVASGLVDREMTEK